MNARRKPAKRPAVRRPRRVRHMAQTLVAFTVPIGSDVTIEALAAARRALGAHGVTVSNVTLTAQ